MSHPLEGSPTGGNLSLWDDPGMREVRKHVPADDIPASEDLYPAADLEESLATSGGPPLSLLAGGDTMLGERAQGVLARHGADYPFQAVLPLLRRASIVLVNLEGPLACRAAREARNFSYKVDPGLAGSLRRAGVTAVTLANNHIMDCGRAGVLETLDTMAAAGIGSVGGGANERAAHQPLVMQAGRFTVGLLGYYWNHRCAATPDLPGAALSTPEALEADIRSLADRADRVVVMFHWGLPYTREPSPRARAKARLAVDCGADAVIGHHPHVIQPFEIYRGCPIFYSVGNFAFGSGNSRAEGLVIGLRFEETRTVANIYPLYVKNRDPRVNYQPKVLRGVGAEKILRRLAAMSGSMGCDRPMESNPGILSLPRPSRH